MAVSFTSTSGDAQQQQLTADVPRSLQSYFLEGDNPDSRNCGVGLQFHILCYDVSKTTTFIRWTNPRHEDILNGEPGLSIRSGDEEGLSVCFLTIVSSRS